MSDKDIRVLVVDDFSTMRRIVRGILKRLGYKKIDEAENGKQALKLLREAEIPFGLVVCDWNMPEMSGIELLREVRADSRLEGLPFLMVTAEAKKENIMEAINAKVTNYIVKPFTEEILAKKLEDIFKSQAA